MVVRDQAIDREHFTLNLLSVVRGPIFRASSLHETQYVFQRQAPDKGLPGTDSLCKRAEN